MINIFHRTIKEEKLVRLDRFKVASWVNLCEPTEAEMDEVVEMLGVDRSLITDSLDINEMPRLEMEKKVAYIYVRVPEKVNGNIITVPLLIAVGQDFVLTVSSRKCSLLNDFISGKVNFYTTQKTKFFLQLFFAINEKYNNLLIDMNKRLRNIKVRLERVDAKDLVQFVDFEQVLNDFLSALVPTDSILQKILTGRYIELYEKDKDLIEDISLGNTQLIEVSKSSLRYAVNIRDTYSNIATHDLNRIMKILTVLTILLTIPNVIFGFFGMNVLIPGMDLSHSYLWIIGSTVVLLVTLLFVFIKNKWL